MGRSLATSVVEIKVRVSGLLLMNPHSGLDVKVISLKFKSVHISSLFQNPLIILAALTVESKAHTMPS